MAAHARLGPSSADRYMTCLASVSYIALLAQLGIIQTGGSSVYADEGTAAHEIREICLRLGLDPHCFIGTKIWVNGAAYEVTEEMAEFLQPGIDWIREYTDTPDVEIRVDLSPWLPEQFGTMDGGWVSGDTLFASDLKYGAGEPVSAENNRQQKLYALGYWHYLGRPPVKRVVVCIDQPRAGGLKFWECTLDELLAFGEECAEVYRKLEAIAADAPSDPDAFFTKHRDSFVVTEKGCRWCAAKKPNAATGYTGCAAYNEFYSQICDDLSPEIFDHDFDDLDAPEPLPADPSTFSPAKRYFIVRHAKQFTKWLASLHEASLEAALMGNPDPGSKVVIGQKGDRYFTDKVKAKEILESALGDEAYKPRDIIGIVDAEKRLKPGKKKPGHPEAWEDLSKLVDQPDGKPILVPADDARPAVKPLADEFDDL